jgi:large subunit ribosomal protein L15
MKLHDLRPADGSRTERTRVGRGIAAGKGKTAGRGTKGQKARSGGSIPPWFEGGQTPLHVRIPKLRGFKNRLKLQYEVVNVGDIGAAAERGAFEAEAPTGKGKGKAGGAQVTINQDILRAVGLVRTLDKPLKILGAGELGSPLFVVADAFSASAKAKIEAAGGSVNVLEVPTRSMPPIGVDAPAGEAPAKAPRGPKPSKPAAPETADVAPETAERPVDVADVAADETEAERPAAVADAAAEKAEAPADEPETSSGEAVTADETEASAEDPKRMSGDDA